MIDHEMKVFLQLYVNTYRGLSPAAWMLALVMLVNRTGAMVLPFLGVYMTNALGFGIRDVGIVLAAFGIGAVIGSWLGGWLTDRFGNFSIQSISLLLSVPLFLVIPQFTTVTSLAVTIAVLSVVTESFRPANSVSVARYAKPENMTKAFSLNRMAINLGFSVGPAMGGLLASISYQWIFYGNALGCLIAAVIFIGYFRNRRENPKRTPAQHDKPANAAPPLSPYRDRRYLSFSVLCFAYAVCFFQLLSTLPLFYQKTHLMDEKQVGYILGFSGFIVVLFEMLLVHLAEHRLSYASSIALGIMLCGVSFALLPLAPGLFMLYLSIFLLSISEIFAMPFMASVAIKRSTYRTQGAYMGLNALAFSAAHIFSPFVGTTVADAFGFPTLWWGTAALLTATSVASYYIVKRL